MYEVFDMNTGETLHRFRSVVEAMRCARDMNEPHLDKMYGVRSSKED